LAELVLEAGFPEGAVNIVTGRGPVAGAALASHNGVDFISFTRSPVVGQQVQKLAADHFIPCTLELGGKSPQVVFADADLDAAIPVICRAIVQNAGQTCSAGSRVLVERRACDAFDARLGEAFRRLRAGSPEMDLDCGPIINQKQKARVQGFVDQAQRDGLTLVAEGEVAAGVPAGGFFAQAALFGGAPPTHPLASEEVFGPVLAVLPFEDEADAIRLANATEYRVGAAGVARDGGRPQGGRR